MRSPTGNHELRPLEGNASDIHLHAEGFIELSSTMAATAHELTAIGDSSVHTSKGTDKLAESATAAATDLSAAAIRYEQTGTALNKYAQALDAAQSWIHPRIDDIENAERSYQLAREEKNAATDRVAGLEHRWPWEEAPSDEATERADDALSAAAHSLTIAGEERDELWTAFDSTFVAWAEAYDEAVEGIQNAMDSANNNDGVWEGVDFVLSVLGWALIVLSAIALIIGAPFTGLLAAIILTVSLVSLALTLIQAVNGRATASDVAWSIIGLIPFGIGKLLSKGVPALSAVIHEGRGIATVAIRDALPAARFWRPSSWLTPVNSWLAPITAWRSLPAPGIFVNPLQSIPTGGTEVVQLKRFLDSLRESRWASHPAVQNFVEQTAGLLPGAAKRYANVALWATETIDGFLGAADWQPDIPGLNSLNLGTTR